jgi:hypothetical protein
MAVRNPLYLTGSNNLQELTTAQVLEITKLTCYLYGGNPSVTLSVNGSPTGGGLNSQISDTRFKSGSVSNSSSSFPGEGTTQEPQQVTTNWKRLDKANASVSPTSDTGKTWPVYRTASNQIQAMNLQDIKDTFLHPAIDLLIAATESDDTAGTYNVHTTTSQTNYTCLSSSAIFLDTKANIGGYSSSNIGTSGTYQDVSTNVQAYYLHRRNQGSKPSYTAPLYITGSNNLQTFAGATFEALLLEWIRETASESSDGYQITYSINGSGNNRGTGMLNTGLSSTSGTHATRQVGDDYRAQEFPSGTQTTLATHYLKITKT